jgi:hypothetical protein
MNDMERGEGLRFRAPEELARFFHETYERLAPAFGYRTREASAKPWRDVPERNRDLMCAVAQEVLRVLNPELPLCSTLLDMGCGRPIETIRDLYRCAECAEPFHRDCIQRHFAATPAPDSVEERQAKNRREAAESMAADMRGEYEG